MHKHALFLLLAISISNPAHAAGDAISAKPHWLRKAQTAATATLALAAAHFAPMRLEAQEVLKEIAVPQELLDVRPESIKTFGQVKSELASLEIPNAPEGFKAKLAIDLFNFREPDFELLTDQQPMDFDRLKGLVSQKKLIEEALAADPKRAEALKDLQINTVRIIIVDERESKRDKAVSFPLAKVDRISLEKDSVSSKNKKSQASARPEKLINVLTVNFLIVAPQIANQTATGDNLRLVDAASLLDQLVEKAAAARERNEAYSRLSQGKTP